MQTEASRMRTQIQITSWQGASKAHICPDLGRCRGHSGPASGCPTRTTEGNARLKRVCSGPRFSNDEIELHGVAPGIRHSAAMARNAKRFAGWDCVGSSKATCRPGKCAPPPPKCLRPTDGHSSTSTRTTRHARPRWTPRWETGRVSEVARLIGMVSLTGHSLGDSLTPTHTHHPKISKTPSHGQNA